MLFLALWFNKILSPLFIPIPPPQSPHPAPPVSYLFIQLVTLFIYPLRGDIVQVPLHCEKFGSIKNQQASPSTKKWRAFCRVHELVPCIILELKAGRWKESVQEEKEDESGKILSDERTGIMAFCPVACIDYHSYHRTADSQVALLTCGMLGPWKGWTRNNLNLLVNNTYNNDMKNTRRIFNET